MWEGWTAGRGRGNRRKIFCFNTLCYRVVCTTTIPVAAEKNSMQMSLIVQQHSPAVLHELPPKRSLHVAIISDGNGRWAMSRGLPRSAGHRAGAQTARRIIAAAPGLGIQTLTLFALSSADWKRPPAEGNAILPWLHEYPLAETSDSIGDGARL